MKKNIDIKQILKGKALIIIIIILVIWAVIALVNNFRILTNIFKTDNIENKVIEEYVENSSTSNNLIDDSNKI